MKAILSNRKSSGLSFIRGRNPGLGASMKIKYAAMLILVIMADGVSVRGDSTVEILPISFQQVRYVLSLVS